MAYLITGHASATSLQAVNEKLNEEIQDMDNQLFNIGFNQCDIGVWKDIISEDIEFYDVRTGLNTSFEKEINSFEDKCSKPFDVTRQLVSYEFLHPSAR